MSMQPQYLPHYIASSHPAVPKLYGRGTCLYRFFPFISMRRCADLPLLMAEAGGGLAPAILAHA